MSVRLTVEEIIFTRCARRQGRETNVEKEFFVDEVKKQRGEEVDQGPGAQLASRKIQ